MKASPLCLLAALGLSLTSCDSSSSSAKKETAQTTEPATPADTRAAPAASANGSLPAAAKTATTAPAAATTSTVALPAGLKVGRWQAFLLARQHAVHFVFEVAVEDNKAVGYLVNEGPKGQQRLRCDTVQPLGDSAIISLPGTAATLVVRANGTDHLAGAWVAPDGKKTVRVVFSAIYGELSPLRTNVARANFAGSWCAGFEGRNGRSYPAVVVFEQQGAKLMGSISSAGSTHRYLSGAALADGMGISSFDGRQAILVQAKKLPNGKLEGHFYSYNSADETWTAVDAKYADCPGYPDSPGH